MGAFSRRSLGNVAGPWFLFDANFELTPLEPGPAASSWRGLQWRPRPAGGTLRGRLMPRFRTFQVCPKDLRAALRQAGGAGDCAHGQSAAQRLGEEDPDARQHAAGDPCIARLASLAAFAPSG